MSKRSSAWFIPYEIRPSKQIERRIVLDCIQAGSAAGMNIGQMPYIGMGGFRFFDFVLANKFLSTNRFISIEHDESLIARCDLNKPFESIEIYTGGADDFMVERGFQESSIIWFDFEGALSENLRDDLIGLSSAVKPDSFVFVTTGGEMPKELVGIGKEEKRLERIRSMIGAHTAGVTTEQMKKNGFPVAVALIAANILKFGFAGRSDGEFLPLLRLAYKDSAWMVTVGGFFGRSQFASDLKREVKRRQPFLKLHKKEYVLQIAQYNLTDIERRRFDFAATAPKGSRSAKQQLRRLGFDNRTIEQYKDLMRFIPRYFEALV